MNIPSLIVRVAVLTLPLWATQILAHAEHDKPLYVAESGHDEGRCDQVIHPCQTIDYAARQANKGDRILVAEGSYQVEDVATLFHLISDLVPVEGGHSRNTFKRDPERYLTRLLGVPSEYADELAQKGFLVIVDSKVLTESTSLLLASKLELVSAMEAGHTNVSCEDGAAAEFSCNRIDLVSHLPLSALNNSGGAGNDIWGHFDLNDRREYALMGLRNGVAVVDLSTPAQPRLVSHIPGPGTTWRDLKVLQTYNHSDNRWQAYAYVTADNVNLGVQILDLSELPHQATLAGTMHSDLSAHNVYLSNVDFSTGVPVSGHQPYLHIAGSNNRGGAFNSYSLEDPLNPELVYQNGSHSRANYSHDVASMLVFDERKDSQCVNGDNYCDVLFDFNEDEILLWDKTNAAQPAQLSRTSYPEVSYVHSGWWTEDKRVLAVHDELDERDHGLNTTVRFFDISDLTRPLLLSTYTGSTHTVDHNGFVRGNRYYMSNYERGLTVLDLSDPEQPSEAGFFDTFPLGNNPNFNGAWGVYPFLPSGLILVSDINSGLYILRDRTLDTTAGTLSFSANEYQADEGDTLTIEVQRTGGSAGAISVGYETQIGSADESDFGLTRGRLSWEAGETGSKSFSVAIREDNLDDEVHELFFLRLFDPQGGASLSSPNVVQAWINGLPNQGSISFSQATATIQEAGPTIQLHLVRRGGSEGAFTVSLQTEPENQTLFSIEPQTLSWGDGDGDPKSFALTPIDNNRQTGNQRAFIHLAGDEVHIGVPDQMEITIQDDERPPTASSSGGGSVAALVLLALVMNGLWRFSQARPQGRADFRRARLQRS